MIYIVSEDKIFSRMLEIELKFVSSHSVTVVSEIPEAESDCSLIIFDMDSAGGKGFSGISYINKEEIPAIYFSRSESEEYGADNRAYFFKRPFLVSEFLKTVTSVLSEQTQNDCKTIDASSGVPAFEAPDNDFSADKKRGRVFYRGKEICLSPKEFALLFLLLENRGHAVTREEIISKVWGGKNSGKSNLADVYINYLRAKIDKIFDIRLIVSVRGRGYLLRNVF